MQNFFNNLYDKFILRDLLSFVVPGGILSISVLSIWFQPTDIIKTLEPIHWIFYFLIIGLLFIIGFFIQCVGLYAIPITWTHLELKLYKIWNQELLKKRYIKRQRFFKISNESEKRQLERIVVLKQLCSNNFLSILPSSIILFINIKDNDKIYWLIAGITISVFLFIGYFYQLICEKIWEESIIG
jgi:hypothetical protein